MKWSTHRHFSTMKQNGCHFPPEMEVIRALIFSTHSHSCVGMRVRVSRLCSANLPVHGSSSFNKFQVLLWMDKILHHLRFPKMMNPPQIPTNNGCPWFRSGAGFCPSTVCCRYPYERRVGLAFPGCRCDRLCPEDCES